MPTYSLLANIFTALTFEKYFNVDTKQVETMTACDLKRDIVSISVNLSY